MIGGGNGDDVLFGESHFNPTILTGINLEYLSTLVNSGTTSSDNSNTTDTSSDTSSSNSLRIEGENMTLSGNYYTEVRSTASGGSVIRTDSSGMASTTFTGDTGTYNLVIGYFRESDGNPEVTVRVGGVELDSWEFELDTGIISDTRIVGTGISFNPGDVIELEGNRDGEAHARIDYIEFIAGDINNVVLDPDPSAGSDTNTSQTSTSNPANTSIRFEAEGMTLGGDYIIENKSFASGGSLIKTASAGTGNAATATTTFTGATGFYDVVIGYYDENDGNSEITVKVGGVEVDKWLLDQTLGTDLPGTDNFVTRTVASGLTVYSGDVIELQGIADAYERARIDYIEFVPVAAPELQLGNNSDVLRGGGGNDVVFGDIGNDIIYGEDEFNDSSYVQAPDITGGYTYGHSTYILSSAGTWEAAQAEARNLGGHLVTINDAGENAWLQTTFGTSEQFWMGLTDKDVEGSFQWANGEEITYTNWHPNEPNDAAGNQDYGVLNFYSNGQWDDQHGLSPYRGIIEIDWSAGGGNDILVGGGDSDTIYGNSGNDVIYGDDTDATANVKTFETLTFKQGINGYSGTVDTFIHGGTPDTNNSAATELNVDNEDLGGKVQSLIRFDDIFGSQPGQIAWYDTINSAFLELEVTGSGGDSLQIYEMLQNWTDSATWNSLGNGIQADGVEAATTSVATTAFVNPGKLTIDVTASLQAWQANPNANYGWAFLSTGTDGVDFYSAEGGNAPRLVVDVNQDSNTVNLTQGLVGHWTFDQTSGTQATDATGSHNGTLTNFPTNNSQWVTGQVGNALDFDGSNDRVVVSDTPELDITDQITLAAWINVDSFSDWEGIITKGTSNIPYAMDLRADGSLSFTANYSITGGVGTGEWLSNTKLTTNQWHHVAITYDGDAIRFYIDGQLDTNVVSLDLTFATTSQSLVLGADLTGSHFDGSIDDARVYNRALSQADITELLQYQGSTDNNTTIPQGTITYNGSAYLLTDSTMTWSSAQAYAESLGGNLVTINNAAENQWLKNTFGTTENLFIGFSDAETEGTWKWASGEVADWVWGGDNTGIYTDWGPNQPDDFNGNQDYAILSHVSAPNTDKWDDVNSDALFRGIIEIKLPTNNHDILFGNSGHDKIHGGVGNDIISGTDKVAAGYYERDRVTGGGGADRFILGDATQAYYATQGSQDYVVIQDFNASEDVVQVYGLASEYTQQQQGNDVFLSRNGDLVAIFEDVSSLDITGAAFQYV